MELSFVKAGELWRDEHTGGIHTRDDSNAVDPIRLGTC